MEHGLDRENGHVLTPAETASGVMALLRGVVVRSDQARSPAVNVIWVGVNSAIRNVGFPRAKFSTWASGKNSTPSSGPKE
jgi:hypothetical protein